MDPLRIGIAGYGAIGRAIAAPLTAGLPGLRLTDIGVRQPVEAPAPGVAVVPSKFLADHADIVVECAPAAALPGIAEPGLRAGRTVAVLSCAALLRAPPSSTWRATTAAASWSPPARRWASMPCWPLRRAPSTASA